MIIPSHSFGVVAASRRRVVAAVANDVTPNAISPAWNTDTFGEQRETSISNWLYSTRQITGINTTITISVTNDFGTLARSVLCYKVDTSSPSYNSGITPVTYGFTDFNSSASFSVSNGNYITFSGRWTGFFGEEFSTITIRNASDGNAVLATVNFDNYAIP